MRKIVTLCTLLILFACSKENESDDNIKPPLNLQEQIANQNDLNLFGQAFLSSDLDVNIDEITLFAPNDAAMQAFMEELEVTSFNELKLVIGSEYYNAWIASHLLPQSAKLENLHSAYVPTLARNRQGQPIHLHLWRSKNVVYINGQWIDVIASDAEVNSSYVHTIDQVLRPNTILKLVKANRNEFSILERALQITNLAAALNNDQNTYTLIAPNDMAFDQYFQDTQCGDLDGFVVKNGINGLKDLISAHLLKGSHDLRDLNNQLKETELANANLIFTLRDGNLMVSRNSSNYNSEAQVLVTNISGFNGSLNIIDEVLKLP